VQGPQMSLRHCKRNSRYK